jgi:hypothetical protein
MMAVQSSKAFAPRAPIDLAAILFRRGARAVRRPPRRSPEVCALRNLRRGLLRIVFGGEAVNQFAGAHVAEFFADAALEVAVVVAETAELDLQLRVGFEQFPMRRFQLRAPFAQRDQVAQARRPADKVHGEQAADSGEGQRQPSAAQVYGEAAHKQYRKKACLGLQADL